MIVVIAYFHDDFPTCALPHGPWEQWTRVWECFVKSLLVFWDTGVYVCVYVIVLGMWVWHFLCVFVVCVSFCMLLYTSTHLPASIWMSSPICRAFSNPPKFITLEHNILVQDGPSPMSPHTSSFKQGPRYRTGPEKHKVFLCTSFVFLEFWNHACTAVQGFSSITITGGFPTRWELKEYGCRQLRLIHWWNDSGSWSDLFCTERPQ